MYRFTVREGCYSGHADGRQWTQTYYGTFAQIADRIGEDLRRFDVNREDCRIEPLNP